MLVEGESNVLVVSIKVFAVGRFNGIRSDQHVAVNGADHSAALGVAGLGNGAAHEEEGGDAELRTAGCLLQKWQIIRRDTDISGRKVNKEPGKDPYWILAWF